MTGVWVAERMRGYSLARDDRGGQHRHHCDSSMRMAFTRLTNMRLKERASVEISSDPETGISGTFKLPLLISSAVFERWVTGRMTIITIAMSSRMSVASDMPPREIISVRNASAAIFNGTDMGTETI